MSVFMSGVQKDDVNGFDITHGSIGKMDGPGAT